MTKTTIFVKYDIWIPTHDGGQTLLFEKGRYENVEISDDGESAKLSDEYSIQKDLFEICKTAKTTYICTEKDK